MMYLNENGKFPTVVGFVYDTRRGERENSSLKGVWLMRTNKKRRKIRRKKTPRQIHKSFNGSYQERERESVRVSRTFVIV